MTNTAGTQVPGVNIPATTTPATSSSDPFGFGTVATNPPTTTTPATNTAQPIFPGATLSPFYLSQIGTSSVDLGAGLPGGGTMNIDQAINWFDSLPVADLAQVESLLWSAGYYTDANGSPLKTAPVLGTLDDQGRRAFTNALIAANQSGQSVTDTINTAIQSGQGANLRSTLPSAVLGGGNVYTIDLTQPGAANQTTNAIFQAALGRNATADEIAKVTDAVNQGTLTQGLAKEQGAEQSAQQQYQARVNQRNIQYQFETTPKTALGAVPSGPITSSAQFAVSLLQYMGGTGGPNLVTPSNVAFIMGWIQANGAGLRGMNPLGSQNAVPGSAQTPSATPNYTGWDQALQATAAALQSGPYTNIMAALVKGDAGSMASNSAVQSELKKWSGGSYSDITSQVDAASRQAATAAQGAQQPVPQVPPPTMTGPGGAESLPGYTAFLKSGGTPEQWRASIQQEQQANQVAPTGVPAGTPTTPAAAVTPGQQQTNPGDVYVNPTTVLSQNPLSPEQAAYLEATTGPNRFSFAENNYLNAFLATANMIQAGHPTGA